MNIIVCVKQVLDPEIPPTKFKVDLKANKVIPPEGIPPVTSPFDEQAVEAALRIKDRQKGKITVLTVGSASAIDVVRHALAMGADEGFILSDPTFEGSDSFATAYILTKAMKKIGQYDLVLCGRQAADWDVGAVGSIIGEDLGIPVVTLAKKVEVVDGKLKIERVVPGGHEVVELPPPAVITVGSEIGQPRIPSGWGIISAARKAVPIWKAADLQIEPSMVGSASARSELVKLFIPVRERKCEIMGGDSVAEAATKLAVKLRQDGVI